MSPSEVEFTSSEAVSRPLVLTERRIFVGDDKEAFSLWLRSLAEAYAKGRVEGFVLDLTGGSLWAFLDLSEISQELYDDIALRAVESDDASASEAFLRLTRSCDPTTAINKLSCKFDSAKWPSLAATCSLFVGRADRPSVTKESLFDSVKLLEPKLDRRKRFRLIAQKAAAETPSQLRCYYDLVHQAHQENWPRWAVECLPSLFIPISAPPSGGMKALVWHYLLACLPAEYYEIHARLCQGAVDEASLSPRAVEEIRRAAPVFERRRLENSFHSEKSTIGVVVAARIETGLVSDKAPIGEELKQLLVGPNYAEEVKEVVDAMTDAPREKVVRLAKQDKWPSGALAALRSETSRVPLNV